MMLLSIKKIENFLEIAELIHGSRGSGRIKPVETFLDKLSNYLDDFHLTGKYSLLILHKYIEEFSQEEKAELIALMWLGRSVSNESQQDFSYLVEKVRELIPQNYATTYIINNSLLVRYLRNGLQKINICAAAAS
ncbi:DUF3775 domain-containing protein [Nostoc sp. LEGE 06077]|uniref:DUF3775 domain-containing protein n=1 Tax=Nostoc sp. LEGE 06077 TaxID=915325 RepID=UPI00187F5F33|nr:DUF3775 domain-containing protein [Nostoc sp. LEGE 06077]MBE9205024.1 DUF3775 domain-containing protein [Nostoc sp. LEGE 06077]